MADAFDVFLVTDLQAACEGEAGTEQGRELLELPIVMIPAKSLALLRPPSEGSSAGDSVGLGQHVSGLPVRQFRHYVRPTDGAARGKARQLSSECTTRTGIKQSDVDGAKPLPGVLLELHKWLDGQGLLRGKRLCFVTLNDDDLGERLPAECARKNVPLPSYFTTYINVQRLFATRFLKTLPLAEMLTELGLPLLVSSGTFPLPPFFFSLAPPPTDLPHVSRA